MEIKTIKGISDEKWMRLKVLAAKKKMLMGKLVEDMIDNYEKHTDKVWDKILYGEKVITDKEAEELHRLTKKLRKEKWVRNADI